MLLRHATCGAPAPQTYADDVFSAYTYTGNGSTQTITNGIDLAGKGGMVWIKGRSDAFSHSLYDTSRGAAYNLTSNATNAQNGSASPTDFTSFNSNGFSIAGGNNYANVNNNTTTYASWAFRNAPKFYTHSVQVVSGSNVTVDLSTLGVVGMVRVKRTDSTGSWYIWHKDLTAGKLLIGETTAAEATLGHITMSGTTLTLVQSVIGNGTFLVEGFAHDTSATGIIQCGSFTTDGSGNATVNLGWEPQYTSIKSASGTSNWFINDSSRPWPVLPGYGNALRANTSGAEGAADGYSHPSATGFNETTELSASTTYIYLAIRRPNKPPTLGTQVYNAIARTGTGAAASVTGVGFAPDSALVMAREVGASSYGHLWFTQLTGAGVWHRTTGTQAEITDLTGLSSFSMGGVTFGNDSSYTASVNRNGYAYINHFFRRAPGVMDQICYGGTGSNKTETIPVIGVAPELWLVKGRSGATQWVWGSSLLANTEKIVMPSPAGKVTDATAWNSTYPTATTFSIGTAAAVNTSSATYTAYFWATLAGVSKVGLYTGSASDVQVNCGFSAGARFVMAVRVDTGGSFIVVDSVRGIVAGSDPSLCLDTTAAEVTGADIIDPLSSGFIAVAGGILNPAAGATMLFLAYA